METISIGYYRKILSLDRSQEFQVFARTTQAQWITSEIVSQTARLWFYSITYFRKNKYKSRYFIKKGLSRYQG